MSVNPDRALEAAAGGAARAGAEPAFSDLRVALKNEVAQGIYHFELRDPDGKDLPAFTPGSHLTVQLPNGMRRNYSLCSEPADRGKYGIAVKRDARGRGGSVSMVDDVRQGDLLPVSAPRNNFGLAEHAGEFIFIAGGIGITPILSMMRHLKRVGSRFRLYYCTRDPASTAFLTDIGMEFSGQAEIHHDHGDMAQALDLWPMLEKPVPAHVYCCGPRGLMESVADMTGHWPSGAVHFESFGLEASACEENKPFRVHLEKTGCDIEVSAKETILEALRAHGLRVPSSCESGTCGSCRTGLLAGEAEHRDMVLGDDEKDRQIMVCVSRAKSAELVLDL